MCTVQGNLPQAVTSSRTQESFSIRSRKMAESEIEATMGTGAWGNRRQWEGWHRGQTRNRRGALQPQEQAPLPTKRSPSQQICNQATPQEKDPWRAQKRVQEITKIRKSSQNRSQSANLQFPESCSKTHQKSGKHTGSTMHWTCAPSSLPTPV